MGFTHLSDMSWTKWKGPSRLLLALSICLSGYIHCAAVSQIPWKALSFLVCDMLPYHSKMLSILQADLGLLLICTAGSDQSLFYRLVVLFLLTSLVYLKCVYIMADNYLVGKFLPSSSISFLPLPALPTESSLPLPNISDAQKSPLIIKVSVCFITKGNILNLRSWA